MFRVLIAAVFVCSAAAIGAAPAASADTLSAAGIATFPTNFITGCPEGDYENSSGHCIPRPHRHRRHPAGRLHNAATAHGLSVSIDPAHALATAASPCGCSCWPVAATTQDCAVPLAARRRHSHGVCTTVADSPQPRWCKLS
jgi:hypothetical protein